MMSSDAESTTAAPALQARSQGGSGARINFDASATLRKWPSIGNNRFRSPHWSEPYFLFEGPLDMCIREFLAKPASQHHLYEIRTEPQTQLLAAVLSAEQIVEIARLRDFL